VQTSQDPLKDTLVSGSEIFLKLLDGLEVTFIDVLVVCDGERDVTADTRHPLI
jgi:hypothetical protein